MAVHGVQLIAPAGQDGEGLVVAPVGASVCYGFAALRLGGEDGPCYGAGCAVELELAFDTYGNFCEGVEDRFEDVADGRTVGVEEGVGR